MQNIKTCQTKKSKFSNFVSHNHNKTDNDFTTPPFVKCLEANICEKTGLGQATINLSNSTKIEYSRECCSQAAVPPKHTCEKTLNLNRTTRQSSFLKDRINDNKTKMIENNYKATNSEPLSTQEHLASLPFDRTFNVVNFLKQEDYNDNNPCNQQNLNPGNMLLSGSALTKAYLEKKLCKLEQFAISNVKPEVDELVDRAVDTELIANSSNTKHLQHRVTENTQTELKTKSFSFMSPTISSERKNQSLEIKHIETLISPTRKARSVSPKRFTRSKALPSKAFDRSDTALLDTEKPDNPLKLESRRSCVDLGSIGTSSTITENAVLQLVNKLRYTDWNVGLRYLAEIVEMCKTLDPEYIQPHMTVIYQKLIDFIKSPRSHVSRTSCQAAGHIFEYVKDTRRPEFDELVDSLLCKCADSNKFIRQDANLALDCMVTHIPTFHAIRAICSKGPEHKNPLVRTAAARIVVCAVVLAGPPSIIHPSSNEYTKRRIIMKMAGFLEDRSPDVRKYGERIYKMLSKDKIFDVYLDRFLEKDVIIKMKKLMDPPQDF